MLGELVVPVLRREFAKDRPRRCRTRRSIRGSRRASGARQPAAVHGARGGARVTAPVPAPARRIVVVTAGLGVAVLDPAPVATAWRRRPSGTCATPAPTVDVEVVELREHAQDLVNHLLTGFPSPALQAVIDAVVAADGLIAVTPIFNASYSGLFKLFFDVDRAGRACRACRPFSRRQAVRPATRWRSTTRCGRCSPT